MVMRAMITRGAIFAGATLVAASGLAWPESSHRQGLASSLHKQIGPCWPGTEDLGREGQIRVVVRIRLGLEGNLLEGPIVLIPEPGATLHGEAEEAVTRAKNAVTRCAPYDLPKDKYKFWEEVEVAFTPNPRVHLIS